MEQKHERNAFAVLDVIGEVTAAMSGAGDNNQATRDMARWLLWRITTGWTEGKPEMRGVDEAIRTTAATALAAYFDGAAEAIARVETKAEAGFVDIENEAGVGLIREADGVWRTMTGDLRSYVGPDAPIGARCVDRGVRRQFGLSGWVGCGVVEHESPSNIAWVMSAAHGETVNATRANGEHVVVGRDGDTGETVEIPVWQAFPGPPATSFSRWRNPKTEAKGAPFDEPTNGVVGAEVKDTEDFGGFEVGDDVEWRDGRGGVWPATVVETRDGSVVSETDGIAPPGILSTARRTFRRELNGGWGSGIMTLHMRKPAGIPAPTPHDVEVNALKSMIADRDNEIKDLRARIERAGRAIDNCRREQTERSAKFAGLLERDAKIESQRTHIETMRKLLTQASIDLRNAHKDREGLPDISKDALKHTW